MTSGHAVAANIGVLLSQDSPHYTRFLQLLEQQVPERHTVVFLGTAKNMPQDILLEKVDIVIVAGPGAAQLFVPVARLPTLAVLLSQAQFSRVMRKAEFSNISAIYLDAPFSRYFSLIRETMPDAASVGVLTGPHNPLSLKDLREEAVRYDLRINAETVNDFDELLHKLQRLLRNSDVLLALPDPVTSDPVFVRPILLTSYRFKRPLFAYSNAYVNAGAIAATYSDTKDIVSDLLKMLDQWQGGRLPPPRAVQDYRVSVNAQVARTLEITLPGADQLLQKVQQAAQ